MEALIALTYGDLLDPSRYGPIMEFQETAPRDEGRGRLGSKRLAPRHGFEGPEHRKDHHTGTGGRRGNYIPEDAISDHSVTRVYVGLGRRHGASVKEVVKLLTRAGGVPGRLVDAIEMRDYCSFATLPDEAARRACAFSRKASDDPTIKPASPQ